MAQPQQEPPSAAKWWVKHAQRPMREQVGRCHQPNMTTYELARLRGARAVEVAFGAEPHIPVDEGSLESPFSPLDVAIREIDQGIAPNLVLLRHLPNGQIQTMNIADARKEMRQV